VHAAGTSTYFGVEVAPEARQAIVRLSAQEVLSCPELVSERLGGGSVGRFETYVALEPFPGASCEGVRIRNGRAVLDEAGGRPVSWAWSVRESDHAAECAVETAEPFRRRGLAARVTAAWANQVLAAGKVPFYSHETGNEASRALAARLALPHVFTLLGFT
jgi:hypothetical protein